jgi:hypothetical protein
MQRAETARPALAPGAGPGEQRRRKRVWTRLKLEARLHGLGGAWHQLEAMRSLEATARSLPARDSFGVGDPEKVLAWESAAQQRAELVRSLRRQGFTSVEEFERTLAEHAAVLREDALALAEELLSRYEQVLRKEEERYQSAQAAAQLHGALRQTQTKLHYKQAREHEAEALQWGPDAELHRQLPGHREQQQVYERLAARARQQAEAEVRRIAAQHPLLAQQDFERERLVEAAPEQVQGLLRAYIKARLRDVAATRESLERQPELVYKLDRLLATLCIIQGIEEGSTGDLLLRARVRELEEQERGLTLVVTVLALAAGLLSAGSGTAGVLAAGVGLGLGAYDVVEQLRQYERQSAAYGAQLVSEDASLTWVVVAVLGAGLDLAVVAGALRSMGPALRTFQKSGDLGQLKKSLQALSRVEAELKERVLEAAQQRVWYQEAVRKFHAAGYLMHVTLLAGTEHFARALEILYYQLKQGVIAFDRILLELKKQKLIKQVDKLTREELRRLQEMRGLVAEIVEHGEALRLSDAEAGAVVRGWAEAKEGKFTLEELKERLSARAKELAEQAASGAGKKGGGRPGGAAAGKAAREAELPRLHWRTVLGPEAENVLQAIIRRTRSMSEALGELAMEVALKRLELIADSRFVKRYHGREKIAIDKKGRMVGVEAKGRMRSSTGLDRHSDETLQLSRRSNYKRAKLMCKKRLKIGKSTKRLGGAYTRSELELYGFLDERKGMKRLISAHVHVETGRTRVFERDGIGNIIPSSSGESLDEFMLDDLQNLKVTLERKRSRK